MTAAEKKFRTLWAIVRGMTGSIPAVAEFAPNLPAEPDYLAPNATRLPVHPKLPSMLSLSGDATRKLAGTVLDAIDDAQWQQTYTEAQVGSAFLAEYGWFNVLSPDGPLVSRNWRVAIAVWGAGLSYPPHRHTPEELYVVIAGGAHFRTEGLEDAWLGPGDTRHHRSDVLHGMEIGEVPLAALVFWKGPALMRPSTLAPQ